METSSINPEPRSWTRDHFLISTESNFLPIQKLIEILDSKDTYWAKTLSPSAMKQMIQSSLCFGLYDNNQLRDQAKDSFKPSNLIGFARLVTDTVTFVYLTDVWVDPTRQGEGLGSWLIQCVNETIDAMPDLRRAMLLTGDWERSVPFYEKLMGMKVVESETGISLAVMEKKGPGHPSYGKETTGYN